MGEIDLVALSLPTAQSSLDGFHVAAQCQICCRFGEWRRSRNLMQIGPQGCRICFRSRTIQRCGEDFQLFRMILFILEFAVRYLMVPGRVENWVLIVELLARFALKLKPTQAWPEWSARIWRAAACQWQLHLLSAQSAGAFDPSFSNILLFSSLSGEGRAQEQTQPAFHVKVSGRKCCQQRARYHSLSAGTSPACWKRCTATWLHGEARCVLCVVLSTVVVAP